MARTEEKQPLKVLHIDPERNWGGGESQVLGLLMYLAQQGHSNHLLAHPGGLLYEKSRELGIRTLPLTLVNDLDIRAVFPLRRLISREKYQIVHLHTKRAHALSLWLPRGSWGSKYVVTRRMDYPESNNWYTRHLYNRRVDGVVAISQTIAKLLIEAGVEKEKIRVIHSGIDPEPFRSVERAQALAGSSVVGTVAVLEARKGHRYLLEAASLLKSRGYRISYRFAGDGSLRESLRARAEQLGLKEDVLFAGFVSDIRRFLSDIDIFVLPSLYEGLGVAALEAMAAGKPVVASRVGGLAEAVLESVTGFLVPPGNAEALAKAIASLLRERSLAREMGLRGAQRIQEHFTLRKMAQKNEEYYYALLSERKDISGL